MKKIKRAIAVMLAMLMTIQLIACGNSTETKDEGTEENKITVCLPRNEMDSTGYIEGKTREFEAVSYTHLVTPSLSAICSTNRNIISVACSSISAR